MGKHITMFFSMSNMFNISSLFRTDLSTKSLDKKISTGNMSAIKSHEKKTKNQIR